MLSNFCNKKLRIINVLYKKSLCIFNLVRYRSLLRFYHSKKLDWKTFLWAHIFSYKLLYVDFLKNNIHKKVYLKFFHYSWTIHKNETSCEQNISRENAVVIFHSRLSEKSIQITQIYKLKREMDFYFTAFSFTRKIMSRIMKISVLMFSILYLIIIFASKCPDNLTLICCIIMTSWLCFCISFF